MVFLKLLGNLGFYCSISFYVLRSMPNIMAQIIMLVLLPLKLARVLKGDPGRVTTRLRETME